MSAAPGAESENAFISYAPLGVVGPVSTKATTDSESAGVVMGEKHFPCVGDH
jgi:hypothetical protein